MKLRKVSDIQGLIDIYKDMSKEAIEDEISDLTNLIYALLIVTESESIEVMFDRKAQISMRLEELNPEIH